MLDQVAEVVRLTDRAALFQYPGRQPQVVDALIDAGGARKQAAIPIAVAVCIGIRRQDHQRRHFSPVPIAIVWQPVASAIPAVAAKASCRLDYAVDRFQIHRHVIEIDVQRLFQNLGRDYQSAGTILAFAFFAKASQHLVL